MDNGMRELLCDLSPSLSVGIIAGRMMALDREIAVLEKNGVRFCHFDIMDGGFVPMLTVGGHFSRRRCQSIQANDVLLVLEAMKMETVVTAVRAGKVSKVNVNPGDSVQGGQVLIELE